MVMPSKRNDLPRFQRWSSTYDRSWLQSRLFEPGQQALLEIMEKQLLIPPNVVVDVGSGTGRLLRTLHARWPEAELIGIDPTPGMVESARKSFSSARFIEGFAETLPLDDATVPVAVSSFSFHHWTDQGTGLQEIVRVLQPDGYFFLADAMLPRWLSLFFPRSHMRNSAQRNILFEQAGLQVVQHLPVLSGKALITVGRKADSPSSATHD